MAAVAATALSVTPCGDWNETARTTTTSAEPTVTTTTVAAEAAAWMDKVCGELVELREFEPPRPTDLRDGDLRQVLDRFDQHAAEEIAAVNQTINDLTSLAIRRSGAVRRY